MRTRRIKPDYVIAELIHSYGQSEFISVSVLLCAGHGRAYIKLYAANLSEAVFNRLSLEVELKFVVGVLKLTSAAFFEYGAYGNGSVRRKRVYLG